MKLHQIRAVSSASTYHDFSTAAFKAVIASLPETITFVSGMTVQRRPQLRLQQHGWQVCKHG